MPINKQSKNHKMYAPSSFMAAYIPGITALLLGGGTFWGAVYIVAIGILYQVSLFGFYGVDDNWFYVGKVLLATIFSFVAGWMVRVHTHVFTGGKRLVWLVQGSGRFTSWPNSWGILALTLLIWILAVIYEFTWYFWYVPIIMGVVKAIAIAVAWWMVWSNRDSMKATIPDPVARAVVASGLWWQMALVFTLHCVTYLGLLWRFIPALVYQIPPMPWGGPSAGFDDYFVWIVTWGIWLIVVMIVTVYAYWKRGAGALGGGSWSLGPLTGKMGEPATDPMMQRIGVKMDRSQYD